MFDIDYHRYIKTGKNINDSMDIIIERDYAYFGGGAQGSNGYIRKWRRIYKDVYRYYGVSEENIRNKTQRYAAVALFVRALFQKKKGGAYKRTLSLAAILIGVIVVIAFVFFIAGMIAFPGMK